MSNQEDQSIGDAEARKAALDARLESVGWGVLLITIGTIWLLPEKQIPQGSWLIAAGLILLGLNVIRYFNGIRMSGFSLVLGTLALLAGAEALRMGAAVVCHCSHRDRSLYAPEAVP